MKVRAIKNTSESLSKKLSINYIQEELEIGKIYNVYGICYYNDGTIEYLISCYGYATFSPAEFFEILDETTPSGWYFNTFNEDELKAIFGYKELALNREHSSQLELRDSIEDKDIFDSRKKEIDEWGEKQKHE